MSIGFANTVRRITPKAENIVVAAIQGAISLVRRDCFGGGFRKQRGGGVFVMD
jgi:hypothetical protein